MSQHGSAPARLSTSTAPAPALGLRWRWPALGSQHAALGAGNSCAGARLRWRWSALALGRSALALGIPALALSCAGAGLRWRWGRSALALGFLRWRWAALPLSSLSQYVPVTTVQFQLQFSGQYPFPLCSGSRSRGRGSVRRFLPGRLWDAGTSILPGLGCLRAGRLRRLCWRWAFLRWRARLRCAGLRWIPQHTRWVLGIPALALGLRCAGLRWVSSTLRWALETPALALGCAGAGLRWR